MNYFYSSLVLDELGLLLTDYGAVCIPDADLFMQLTVLVIGHVGRAGHWGVDCTFEGISTHFMWPKMKSNVAVFVNSCLYCLPTVGDFHIPCLLSDAIHETRPNEILHFKFRFMGP